MIKKDTSSPEVKPIFSTFELDSKDKLFKALDQITFERDMSGMLTKDGFLSLRNLITDLTQEEFNTQKEELMQQRLKAFKESDWQRYAQCIDQARNAYQKLVHDRSMQALEHIDITEENYGVIVQKTMQDPI